MDRKKLDTYNEAWEAIAERLGGNSGKEVVEALKELYSVYDDGMVEWMASLYDPEAGAWYHSRSGQATEGYGPDAESTIEVFQFLEATGMTGGRPYTEVTPKWLGDKVAKFCYELQDPDGYFYHPQWGKEYYLSEGLYSRRSRDSEWCARLIEKFSDGKLKYPKPGEERKGGAAEEADIPERWRSVENYKKYLCSEDLMTRSYPIGNMLLAESQERDRYSAALGVDLGKITVDFLNERVSPKTGLWQGDDTSYPAVNALCKIAHVYNKTASPLPYPVEGIRSSMRSLLSEKRVGAATDILNPWSSITNSISNIRRFGEGDALADEMLREVRDWAAEGIRSTAEKIKIFKMPDGGMSYSPSGCCPTSQRAPVAVPGSREGDINGCCCASSAIIDYIFRALDIRDIMVPLFDGGDLERFFEIVSGRESEWELSKKTSIRV